MWAQHLRRLAGFHRRALVSQVWQEQPQPWTSPDRHRPADRWVIQDRIPLDAQMVSRSATVWPQPTERGRADRGHGGGLSGQ